jgi:hypothetical protein
VKGNVIRKKVEQDYGAGSRQADQPGGGEGGAAGAAGKSAESSAGGGWASAIWGGSSSNSSNVSNRTNSKVRPRGLTTTDDASPPEHSNDAPENKYNKGAKPGAFGDEGSDDDDGIDSLAIVATKSSTSRNAQQSVLGHMYFIAMFNVIVHHWPAQTRPVLYWTCSALEPITLPAFIILSGYQDSKKKLRSIEHMKKCLYEVGLLVVLNYMTPLKADITWFLRFLIVCKTILYSSRFLGLPDFLWPIISLGVHFACYTRWGCIWPFNRNAGAAQPLDAPPRSDQWFQDHFNLPQFGGLW